jgi:sarcosine oxidase subunit beta|tara:strand:- start:1181 stop:2347 length:1167 start_codon:yes stop_codon:yes gene_type:complete
MNNSYDTVIVGGGVMGCSIQHNLADRGMNRSLLVEKDVLGSGSTSRSQAILRMHYSNPETALMAWESLKVFRNFEEITGASSGFTKTGYLLAVPEHYRKPMLENLKMQQQLGIDVDEVDFKFVQDLGLNAYPDEGEAYCWEPLSGFADPYSVTVGYANQSRKLGCEIDMGNEVTAIKIDHGRVVGVKTSTGDVHSDRVVVAAGPWSGPLLNELGLDFGLKTVRHQVFLLDRGDNVVGRTPIIGDVALGFSARPDIGNVIMVGVGEDEVVGPSEYNQSVDTEMLIKTQSDLSKRIPGVLDATFVGGWSGLFTVTPDWHPILSKIDGIEGLYVAVGFSGHGFKLSPMIGQVMGDIILGQTSKSIDISSLGADRFKNGRLMKSRYDMQVLA